MNPRLLLTTILFCLLGCTQTIAPLPTPVPAINTPVPEPTQTLLPTDTPQSTSTLQPTAVPQPTETPLPPAQAPDAMPLGVQIQLHGEDVPALIDHLVMLRASWVKSQVSWKVFEPQNDQYDQDWLDELDLLVNLAAENDIQVMLSVAKAPDWARPTTEEDGPPTNNEDYTDFLAFLATRYKGRVAAYELWNEPNLRREWNGLPLSSQFFAELVVAGATGVKSADSDALTISGAPAVTGINDGIVAIDDRQFVRGMIDAGMVRHVDAIGIHPYGWANPPQTTFENPDKVVSPTHNDHPSFFFLDTLRDYRIFLVGAGHPDKLLWVTEFGWGTFDQFEADPPEGVAFMNNINETQQAEYTMRAIEMMQADPLIAVPMLWNLNFASHFGDVFEFSGYGLLRPDGSERPVYEAVRLRK